MNKAIADAARKGAPLVKHIAGQLFRYRDGELCACYLGVVALGSGIVSLDEAKYRSSVSIQSRAMWANDVYQKLEDEFPELIVKRPGAEDNYFWELIARNDTALLSVEEINALVEADAEAVA